MQHVSDILLHLENGKLDYAPEGSEPNKAQPSDISAKELLLPITKERTEAPGELENSILTKDTASASTGLEQREKLKITFNKKFSNTVPASPNLLKSLFGDDDEDLKVMPKLKSENAQELTCKQEKNCKTDKGSNLQ
jgi:hypothetical protein